MDDARLDEFRELFGDLTRAALERGSSHEPAFRVLLRDHLGMDPTELQVVAEKLPLWDHANLQLAVEALIERARESRLVGIGGGNKRYMPLSLSDLVNEHHFRPSAAEYVNVPVGPDEEHACLLFGVVLLRLDRGAAALLVRRGDEHGPNPGLAVEAVSPTEGLASDLLAELRSLMRERNVYRGKMFSLEQKMWERVDVRFHERPTVARSEIVLPDAVLDAVEGHVVEIGRQADALRAAGRHLKRGVLLHGPPGTGKTLTVKWLASELREVTVLVLAGGGLGLSGPMLRLARELQPSVVVLEDVDLVGEERTAIMPGAAPVLFELLNELDGLADDADVAVVLTTNRPDLLEPALAARPGRVDLAVEVPLPDAPARRRLLDVYANGLTLELADPDVVVARTEGVTASFFRELLRRAALAAAKRQSSTVVVDTDVSQALDELLDGAGRLTRVLLGAEERTDARAGDPRAWLVAQASAAQGIAASGPVPSDT